MDDWTAILIDTNIFIKTKYNFDGGNLERLKSFRHRPEVIVFDDIICGEIVSNLSDHLMEVSNTLKKATKEAWLGKLVSKKNKEFLETLYVNKEEASVRAREYLENYMEECDATQIETHVYSDLDKVISDYFSSEPPFGIREIKKNEFPDALCLNAIHAWAIVENQKVVLVSDDKGWSEYAELYEDRLKVVNSISEALDVFQEFDAREFYTRIVREQWVDISCEIENSIAQALFSEIVEGSTDVEASSYLHFEPEIEDAVVNEIIFKKNGPELDVNLIEAPENGFGGNFYVSITASVTYAVSAIFDFSVYDSIDKDMVPLGGTLEEVLRVDDLEVVACLNFEDDTLNICYLEVSGLPRSIYFGDIEPDFSE